MYKKDNFIKRVMFWIKFQTLYRKYYKCKHFVLTAHITGGVSITITMNFAREHANNLKGYSHKDCTLYVSNTLAPAKR